MDQAIDVADEADRRSSLPGAHPAMAVQGFDECALPTVRAGAAWNEAMRVDRKIAVDLG